ncbi:Tat pathway signal sequence domain protein [Streptomyces sp. NPDC005925]|uniref:Tat pathway signal sequence domain protein n=1 Tax=Streptomyces sp. NPDC005925 TaxID=3157172 RepID=UPI0033CE7F7B
MSVVGPVEPGEGTHAASASAPREPDGRLAALHERLTARLGLHRHAALAGATALVLLAGGGYLYATRPRPPAPPPPPYPSQVVGLDYLGRAAGGAGPGTDGPDGGGPGGGGPDSGPAGDPRAPFAFGLLLTVTSGPPVTVTRIAQPYAGLSLTSVPRTPFRTKSGYSRKIVITMRVTECGNVPMNSGLPFLDVTLRNARVKQVHSFILGPRYARHLSTALQVACSNSSV